MRLCRRATFLLVCLGIVSTSHALPPFDEIIEGLSAFRSSAGDVVGQGLLTFGEWESEEVELRRFWDDRVELSVDGEVIVVAWSDTDADLALRLVSAALAADDLSDALRTLGRSVEPNVETLAFIADEIVYVLGGALDSPTTHLYIERDLYRLRRIDVPMPDGQYRVELASYELDNGWFPRSIIVYLETQKLFQIDDLHELQEIE